MIIEKHRICDGFANTGHIHTADALQIDPLLQEWAINFPKGTHEKLLWRLEPIS